MRLLTIREYAKEIRLSEQGARRRVWELGLDTNDAGKIDADEVNERWAQREKEKANSPTQSKATTLLTTIKAAREKARLDVEQGKLIESADVVPIVQGFLTVTRSALFPITNAVAEDWFRLKSPRELAAAVERHMHDALLTMDTDEIVDQIDRFRMGVANG